MSGMGRRCQPEGCPSNSPSEGMGLAKFAQGPAETLHPVWLILLAVRTISSAHVNDKVIAGRHITSLRSPACISFLAWAMT